MRSHSQQLGWPHSSQQLPLPANGEQGEPLKGGRTWIPSPWSRLRVERGQRCHLRPEPAFPMTLFRSTPFSGPGTDISPKQLSFWDNLSLWSSGPRRAGMEPKQEALGCDRPSKRRAGGHGERTVWAQREHELPPSPQTPAGRKDAESERTDRSAVEAGSDVQRGPGQRSTEDARGPPRGPAPGSPQRPACAERVLPRPMERGNHRRLVAPKPRPRTRVKHWTTVRGLL